MKKYTIFRNRWMRGGKDGLGNDIDGAVLCDIEGQKCCLGHIMTQDGFKKKQLLRLQLPNEVVQTIGTEQAAKKAKHLVEAWDNGYGGLDTEDLSLVNKAVEINDDTNITDDEREELLISLFKENKIKLTFVG